MKLELVPTMAHDIRANRIAASLSRARAAYERKREKQTLGKPEGSTLSACLRQIADREAKRVARIEKNRRRAMGAA